MEVKSGGYISLHGTNKTYQYQFEVIPYTLDKLKRKEKKLEAELNLIRTLINQKEKETKKKLSTPTKKRDRRSAGVEENVQVQPPRKIPVNFNANTYSLKGLTDYAHHYCGIVTKNLPEEYSMCFENNGSTKGLSTNQRVQQNGDIQFWTGESNDAKPIIGYNKSERWMLVSSTMRFIPITLISIKNIHFQICSFSKGGNLHSKVKLRDDYFIPLFHWIFTLPIEPALAASALSVLCEKFISPQRTEFPDTQVLFIVNNILSFHSKFEPGFQNIPLLISFLYDVLSYFDKVKVKLIKESLPMYMDIITYLADNSLDTFKQILPRVAERQRDGHTKIEHVIRRLQPCFAEAPFQSGNIKKHQELFRIILLKYDTQNDKWMQPDFTINS